MGLDISIKLNIEIASEELRNKFYTWSNEYTSDEIGCLSRDFVIWYSASILTAENQ
jgi:hypothetical protein